MTAVFPWACQDGVRHVYVHVPFCHKVCPYCSFFKHTPGGTRMGDFVEAVLEEGRWRRELGVGAVETIYLGGGTPTALSEVHLRRLLEGLLGLFGGPDLVELTVEANPRTVPVGKARMMRELGVNRVSLGVQAWDEPTLKTLGRDHRPEEAAETFEVLRGVGFENVSVDLMFSIPGQSREQWLGSLERTMALGPEHISTYNLNYEEDTEFFERLQKGDYRELPAQDADFFFAACERLEAAGWRHYEISNYAREGRESVHNRAYWFGRDYIGLGPGCTSTVRGRRWQTLRDTEAYIQRVKEGGSTILEEEWVGEESRRIERFGLELRTRVGLPVELVGAGQRGLLAQLEKDALLVLEDGFVRLTRLGMPLNDSIAVALMGV